MNREEHDREQNRKAENRRNVTEKGEKTRMRGENTDDYNKFSNFKLFKG